MCAARHASAGKPSRKDESAASNAAGASRFERCEAAIVVNLAPAIACCMAFASSTVVTGSYSRSEEHTSELQSLMRISYAVFCLKKKKIDKTNDQSSNTYTRRATIKQ